MNLAIARPVARNEMSMELVKFWATTAFSETEFVFIA